MACCPVFFRCLVMALLCTPLVILAVACSNAGAPSTPAASKPAATEATPTRPMEPGVDPR